MDLNYPNNSEKHQRDVSSAQQPIVPEPVVKGELSGNKRNVVLEAMESPIVKNIIAPTAKSTFIEVLKALLHVGNNTLNNPPWQQNKSYQGTTSYNNMYYGRSNQNITYGNQPVQSGNFQPVDLYSQQDVFNVYNQMVGIISQYGYVTVGQYYSLCGIVPNPGEYTCEYFGWRTLPPCEPVYVGHGKFTLRLPQAIPVRTR